MNQPVMPPGEPEKWLPVVGWEGLYEVSSLGRVCNLLRIPRADDPERGRIIRPYGPFPKDPYFGATLIGPGRRKNVRIHVLVATAFLGPRPAGMQVCHGPGGQLDNRVVNLSYGTHAKNMGEDRLRDGTANIGSRNGHAKLTEDAVRECRIRAAAGETLDVLAGEFSVSKWSMQNAVIGMTWRHVSFPDELEPPAA